MTSPPVWNPFRRISIRTTGSGGGSTSPPGLLRLGLACRLLDAVPAGILSSRLTAEPPPPPGAGRRPVASGCWNGAFERPSAVAPAHTRQLSRLGLQPSAAACRRCWCGLVPSSAGRFRADTSSESCEGGGGLLILLPSTGIDPHAASSFVPRAPSAPRAWAVWRPSPT